MSIREMLGIFIILVGLALSPLAWAYMHILWGVCIVLFGVGGYLFFTKRVQDKLEELDKDDRRFSYTGAPMPTDIFNYTGWRSGGQRDNRSTDSDFGGGDSD